MSKVKKSIYDVLKGGFLIDESSFKNWRMMFFIVALLLIMISSAHSSCFSLFWAPLKVNKKAS